MATKKKPATKSGKKRKVHKVMKEYKQGKLKSGKGAHPKVTSRKQAIAIAMSESGQSRGTKKTPRKKASKKSAAKSMAKSSGGRRKTASRKSA